MQRVSGERKVFRSLPISTFVGETPTTLNTGIHLIHLGDMWMNSQAGANQDIPVQLTGVAPVDLLSDGSYQLQGRADDFSPLNRSNNPLYVFLANASDPDRRELATSEDFGANYPVLGTWWVMVRKDLFPDDMHMEIEFFVNSVQQLDTESAFMTAVEMGDPNMFKTEITGAKTHSE